MAGDRRWMIVDEQGNFISQRQHPRMALLQCALEEEQVVVREKGQSAKVLSLPLSLESGEELKVKIWLNRVLALQGPADANEQISQFLGQACRFVYMPDRTHRLVNPRYVPELELVGFADGYPHLLIGQASLDDLNVRLDQPLPMNRFRPNLVVTGSQPNEEFTWAEVRIGEVTFRGRKPCGRCPIPTIDQDTAVKGREPIRTLATYLRWQGKVVFGENMTHEGEGAVRVGDEVTVLRRKENPLD
jgi:uncharacterized protein YcbX